MKDPLCFPVSPSPGVAPLSRRPQVLLDLRTARRGRVEPVLFFGARLAPVVVVVVGAGVVLVPLHPPGRRLGLVHHRVDVDLAGLVDHTDTSVGRLDVNVDL